MTSAPCRVLVDADGCPVVDRAVKIAGEHGAPCILFCDTAHELNRPGARTVTVSQGADSADFALCNACRPGDVAITQDYGLAAMCLARGARALNQDGMVYSGENIDSLLFFRAYSRKVRAAGGRLKGPKKRIRAQDDAFDAALRRLLTAEPEG